MWESRHKRRREKAKKPYWVSASSCLLVLILDVMPAPLTRKETGAILGRRGAGVMVRALGGGHNCSQPSKDAPGAHQAVEHVEFCILTFF